MPWKGVMMKHTTRVSTYQLGNNWIVKIQYFETCRLFSLYNWLPDIEVLLSQTLKKLLLFIDHEMLQALRTVHVKRQCSQEKMMTKRRLTGKKQKLVRQYAEFYVLMILTSFKTVILPSYICSNWKP